MISVDMVTLFRFHLGQKYSIEIVYHVHAPKSCIERTSTLNKHILDKETLNCNETLNIQTSIRLLPFFKLLFCESSVGGWSPRSQILRVKTCVALEPREANQSRGANQAEP